MQRRGKASRVEYGDTVRRVSISGSQVSGIYYLSSIVTSFDPRRGGEDEGPGEFDLCREERRELRDGVLYGVSVGVGREAAAAAAYSSSVSQAFIVLE